MSTVHQQEHLNTVYRQQVFVILVMLAASASVVALADSQHNYHDIYLLLVYSVEILLLMDSGHVRNM